MDDAADNGQANTPSPPPQADEPSLNSIRRILFASEIERIDQLERTKTRLEEEIDALQERLSSLQKDLTAAETRLLAQTHALAADIDDVIARKAATAPEEMAEALGPVMAGAIRVQDRQGREDLVDAVSPVLSEAIEVQIRDSRASLVEALFPIVGEMAQRYIGEFFRELQRNIDARLKTTFTPERAARRATARLSGVSVSELEMRDALPFTIREIFLIQSGSGLLLARAGSDEAVDSDLISGMLTAVRDFVHDSFGHEEIGSPMDEIQYGEQRIVIQDGRLCYLAVVFAGVEPPGFRAELRRMLTRLHSNQYVTLQEFDGDMASLGEVPQSVVKLAGDLRAMAPAAEGPKPLTRGQKMMLALGGLGGLLLFGLACFYLQFTLALWPVAFGDPTATATATPSPTYTVTPSPTSSPTWTTTPPPTATTTATATLSPSAVPTATPTIPPTATVMPFSLRTNRPVWAFSEPDLTSTRIGTIDAGTELAFITYDPPWLLVEWPSLTGTEQGWVSEQWVDATGTPPAGFPLTP